MSYSKLILRDSAEIVWPLDDITESSSVSQAINFFTKNPNSYSASINPANTTLLYNPIVFGGGAALSFTSSAIGLSIPALGRFSEVFDNKNSILSFWFQVNSLTTQESPIFKKRGHQNIGLFIKDNYLIFRYGTSASYDQVLIDFVDVEEPHHIVMSKTDAALILTLDGSSYSVNTSIKLEKDINFSDNDYIDFYGPINDGSWTVDSIAIFPEFISNGIAKRHYVYGLGKTIPDKIFYSRGGNIYNFSTIYTDKLYDINWDYKNEWVLSSLIDLDNGDSGVGPIKFFDPVIYSFDNNLDLNNNKYKFSSSAAVSKASYIEIENPPYKVGNFEYPFFVKFKLDGPLPAKYLSQRLISIGKKIDEEILSFDLYNNDGNYQVKVSLLNQSSSVSFNINNISASPSFYIGMKFDLSTTIMFCSSNQTSLQSASFSYLSASGFGTDPLLQYLPLTKDSVIRIGSSLTYDDTSFNSNVWGVEQFLGSFEKFMVTESSFSSSANYSYLENYRKSRYEFSYNTVLQRFKTKTYGYGSFNIHASRFSEFIDDDTLNISSNYIKIGYPQIQSSSAVIFTATLLSYSSSATGSPIYLSQNNYLNSINNINLINKYLKFDFEIYADDAVYYPPRIKYFKMQTFRGSSPETKLKDDAGLDYTIHPSPTSEIYLPETTYTPSIFMTKNSGIKINNNYVDFSENILPKPLDPKTIPGLKLWLDARFINGLNNSNPIDDSRVLIWKDLSDNNNDAIQNSSASASVYRTQSLNLLRMNQLDGGESDDISFINPFNATISSNIDGAVSGTRGIEITPTGTSTDSYIDMSFNTASITVFPNQSYTVVGTIKLLKPQTSPTLDNNARKIVIFTKINENEIFSASSFDCSNLKGTYSLSAVFTTASNVTGARILFYNGSADLNDKVYWDNMGLYPISSGSAQNFWVQPLTNSDRPIVKFNGKDLFLISTASTNHPSSLYIVARNFDDSIFIQDTSASILYSNSASYFVSYGSAQNYAVSDNSFHIFSIINNGTTTELFIDGVSVGSKNTGASNIDQLIVGKGLNGDIAAILLYDEINSSEDRNRIENWLAESFSIFTI